VETEEHLRIITDGIKIKGTILEVGCGAGRLIVPLADKYPQAKFIGFDMSKRDLDKATPRKNITYTNEFPKEKINFAYSMLTFQHIPSEDKVAYIEEVAKLLVPNGIFRFQFVRGDYHAAGDQNASEYDVKNWCINAGFEPKITQGEGLWNWVTARRI